MVGIGTTGGFSAVLASNPCFSILRVPSATKRRLLPVRSDFGTYWTTGTSLLGEPRRSTYHFTSGVRVRLVRPRCRGNRHEPQPAAQARPIERACSKTVGGRRLDHFSRTSLVTGTRFVISFFASHPPIPSKTLDLGYICSVCMLHMFAVHMYCVVVVRMGGSTAVAQSWTTAIDRLDRRNT